jgi:ribosome maturation factor RimP
LEWSEREKTADLARRSAVRVPQVEMELEDRIQKLGFELVEVVWAGTAGRPILRVRIDVPEERAAGGGVTVGDCAKVSRALEAWLDGLPAMTERYVLEVSSPGLERPLTRPGDWTRFAGQKVAVNGSGPLAGRAKRLEGELLGLARDSSQREVVRLRLVGGEEVEIPREEILRAHVVFNWK